MINPKPTIFFDLSNWNEQPWMVPTIGSRNKSFVEDPKTFALYFFKESKATFPSEFWSEIIASKVGHVLGFNLLDYNIAVLNGRIGCISKKMHDEMLFEDLIHGINILKEKLPGFIISQRPVVTFQQIKKVFENDKQLKNFVVPIIETIIFDSIIGNTDRHTENWGIIRGFDVDKFLASEAPKKKNIFQAAFIRLVKTIFKRVDLDSDFNYTFTPIFDSGSCLGREISEARLTEYINNTQNINRYLDKGWHEIRWSDKKLNAFDLIKNIRISNKSKVDRIIKRTISNFNGSVIETIINGIDNDIPAEFINAKLTLQRKELIKQLIFARVERLKRIIESD